MLLDERPAVMPHFCLVVDGDLAELRARLEAAGVETRDPTPSSSAARASRAATRSGT